jgi:hypothetical protein
LERNFIVSLKTVHHYVVEHLRGVKRARDVRVVDVGHIQVSLDQPGFFEDIVVYMLAGEISVGFIKKTLNYNTQNDKHTLYIVSLDLITEDGRTALMTDALRLLLKAYGNRIYAYRDDPQGVTLLTVYVDRGGNVTLGAPINLADLNGDYADIQSNHILGVRKVVSFEHREYEAPVYKTPTHPLQEFYDVLGVPPGAPLTEIKRAYRHKARIHHPDTDKSPGATARMQTINDAYARIIAQFEEA